MTWRLHLYLSGSWQPTSITFLSIEEARWSYAAVIWVANNVYTIHDHQGDVSGILIGETSSG